MRHLIKAVMTAFLVLASTSVVQAQTTEGTAEEMSNTNFIITVTQGNTQMGVIELKLWPDVAPKHVEFFGARAAEGYYDGSAFHRVIPGFMIQGGDPNSKDKPRVTWGTGGYPEKVVAEFSDKHHDRGVLSAARTNDPNSFGGQFFICVANRHTLDGAYTAFGEVVSGMEVVDMIVNAPRDANDNPLEKIEMTVKAKQEME